MKKFKSIISVTACAAAALSVIPFSASAEENDVIYGTMNIPYADFYAAELEGAPNAYAVDAVSSATSTKALKNGEGELFEGSYNELVTTGEVNAVGKEIVARILGVTYPVAITQADLDALGDNNYGFTPLDSVPEAYKNVSVSNGTASFSAVQDSTPETKSDASLKLSTETPWGDYVIDVTNAPEGAVLGAYVTTADGNKYAFRHEQNIWRGEFAWSSGIKVSEPHGNALDYAAYESIMGKTITSLTYINSTGYVTVPTNTYVPVKFEGSVSAQDAAAGTGKTALELVGFPDDYQKSIDAGDAQATETEISYTNAKPGSYTVSVSDAAGKYASLSGKYTLTTADIPVQYSSEKLAAAEGFTADDAANFIKNIASVEVNGTTFSATGKGSVKVFGEDGTIDFAAAGRNGNVFDGSGNYTVKVTATGYTSPYEFTIAPEEEAAVTTTTTAAAAAGTTTTTKAGGTTTTKAGGSTTKAAAASDSPKTGVAGVAAPAAILALAGTAAIAFRKKND